MITIPDYEIEAAAIAILKVVPFGHGMTKSEAIDYARAALEASAAVKWQPIETAPRDGTNILALWPDGSLSIAWWWINRRMVPNYPDGSPKMMTKEFEELRKRGWSASHFIDHHESDDLEISAPENQPVYWQHLPSPPTPAPSEHAVDDNGDEQSGSVSANPIEPTS